MATVDGKWLSKEGLTYLWSKLKTIFTKQEETNVIVNAGAKNRCPYDGFTASEAGTVINDQPISLSAGNYIISYDTTATTGSSAVRFLYNGNSIANKTIYNNNTGKCSETITLDSDANQIRFYTSVACTVSNLMIRYAEITNATFQPYALPNPTLTPAVIKAVDEGAKNILVFDAIGSGNYHAQTYTSKGVKYILNSDGTITVNRESASSDLSSCTFYLNDVSFKVDNFCNGNFVLSGCPSGGGSSSYEIYVYQPGYSYKDYGNGLVLPNRGEITGIYMGINVRASASPSNLIFKPMICKKTDRAVSQEYVPYAPTNRQLYDSMCRANVTLPSDADLDKIKTHGFYHGQGANITNRPVSGSYNFTLMVIESGEFIIQVFKQLNSAGDPYIFVRRFYVYNTSWGSWYQFSGTAV